MIKWLKENKETILVVGLVLAGIVMCSAMTGCTRRNNVIIVPIKFCTATKTGQTRTYTSSTCMQANNNPCGMLLPTTETEEEVIVSCNYSEWR